MVGVMANSNDYKEIGLNSDKNKNITESSPSSDFDRLEDCNEAEFKGATLSLSQTSPPESATVSACDDSNAATEAAEGATGDKRRSSSIRVLQSSNVQDFFAVREGALQKAAEQCRPVILENIDGDLRGIWLLTEIDHWDTEKERLLFLTQNSLISLKYDFITLRLLDYQRYPLSGFQKIVIGELKYPEKSLMPKINGAMDFFRQRVLPKLRQGRNFRQPAPNMNLTVVDNKPRSAVSRNQLGIQCSWSNLDVIPASKRWNPWSRDIPWVTYTSHPLLKTDTTEKANYNIEDFYKTLVQVLQAQGPGTPGTSVPHNCQVLYQPIVIESYAGLAAALHNANELGFFKSRGKVSF